MSSRMDTSCLFPLQQQASWFHRRNFCSTCSLTRLICWQICCPKEGSQVNQDLRRDLTMWLLKHLSDQESLVAFHPSLLTPRLPFQPNNFLTDFTMSSTKWIDWMKHLTRIVLMLMPWMTGCRNWKLNSVILSSRFDEGNPSLNMDTTLSSVPKWDSSFTVFSWSTFPVFLLFLFLSLLPSLSIVRFLPLFCSSQVESLNLFLSWQGILGIQCNFPLIPFMLLATNFLPLFNKGRGKLDHLNWFTRDASLLPSLLSLLLSFILLLLSFSGIFRDSEEFSYTSFWYYFNSITFPPTRGSNFPSLLSFSSFLLLFPSSSRYPHLLFWWPVVMSYRVTTQSVLTSILLLSVLPLLLSILSLIFSILPLLLSSVNPSSWTRFLLL